MTGEHIKRVLVADDESAVRRLVRTILGVDYSVIEARNGQEAVTMARSCLPDIILMDIVMPVMDGISACTAIKKCQATAGITVIMLTGVSYDLDKKLAENVAGADGYLTKPFNSAELLSTVSRFIDKNNYQGK